MGKIQNNLRIRWRKIRFDLRENQPIREEGVAEIRMSNDVVRRYSIQNLKKDFFSITIKSKDDIFKYLLYLQMLLLVILLPYASLRTGISEKEIQQNHQAELLYNHYANGDTEILKSEYAKEHTQFVDFTCYCIYKWLNLNDVYKLRHITGAIFAWLTILVVGSFLMNMFAWRAAFFGCVFMMLSPPFIGQAFGNLADIPFAFAYLLTLYQIYLFIGELPIVKWKRLAFIALCIFFANSIHIGGFILVFYLFIYGILAFIIFNIRQKVFSRDYLSNLLFLTLIVLSVAGVVYVADFLFPFNGISPNHVIPSSAIAAASKTLPTTTFLWNSKMVSSDELTSFFILQRMQRTIPLLVIIGCIVHFVFVKSIIKKIRLTNAILLLFSIIYPIWSLSADGCKIYDGWMVFLMVYPLIVMFAVAGYEGILRKIDDKYTNFVIVSSIAMLALMPLRHMILHHSTIGIYFNELSGGINTVYGHYAIDPNEEYNKSVYRWVKQNCKADNDSTKVRILTDGGRGNDILFRTDTNIFMISHGCFYERDSVGWDYFISYANSVPAAKLRNKSWEKEPAIKQFLIDSRPIAIVVRNDASPLFAPPIDTLLEKSLSDSVVLADEMHVSQK